MMSDYTVLDTKLIHARETGDTAAEATCLMQLGHIARDEEAFFLAQGLYAQACEAYERADDAHGRAHALVALDQALRLSVMMAQEMPLSMLDLMEAEALAIYEHRDEVREQADIWLQRGYRALFWGGQPRDDERITIAWRTAMRLFEEAGDREGQGKVLAAMAHRELRFPSQARDTRDAQTLFEQALTFYDESSISPEKAMTLYHLGKLAAASGDLSRARALMKTSLALYKQFEGTRRSQLIEHDNELAELALKAGDHDEACAYLEDLVHVYLQTPLKQDLAGSTLRHLATISQQVKDYAAAETYLLRAYIVFRWLDRVPDQTWLLMSLAALKGEMGEIEACRAYYQMAFDVSDRHHDFKMPPYLLWDWGQFEYGLGNYERGRELCQHAIDVLRRHKRTGSLLQEWPQALAAMNHGTRGHSA